MGSGKARAGNFCGLRPISSHAEGTADSCSSSRTGVCCSPELAVRAAAERTFGATFRKLAICRRGKGGCEPGQLPSLLAHGASRPQKAQAWSSFCVASEGYFPDNKRGVRILAVFLNCSFPSPSTQRWGLMICAARLVYLREESDIFFCFSSVLMDHLVLAIRTIVISSRAL